MTNFFKTSGVHNYSEGLFISKYAPRRLVEFKGNHGVKQTLESFFDSTPVNLPNLLISGPHGCGKSLLGKLVACEYLGDEYLEQGLLTIYGSLSRGKDVVSEKKSVKNKQKNFNCLGIANFMKKRSNLPKNMVKIALIYEFHQMSKEAQMALRRIMERFSHRIRFIFVSESPEQIIQAVQSRCTPFNLHKLDSEELINEIILPIIKAENLVCNNEMLELIKLNSDGDIRISVNMLQIIGKTKKPSCWYQILGAPETKTIRDILDNCGAGAGAGNIVLAYRDTKKLLDQGFEICDLLDLITRVLIHYPDFEGKREYLRILGVQTLSIERCYTDTQLYNLLNCLSQIRR